MQKLYEALWVALALVPTCSVFFLSSTCFDLNFVLWTCALTCVVVHLLILFSLFGPNQKRTLSKKKKRKRKHLRTSEIRNLKLRTFCFCECENYLWLNGRENMLDCESEALTPCQNRGWVCLTENFIIIQVFFFLKKLPT